MFVLNIMLSELKLIDLILDFLSHKLLFLDVVDKRYGYPVRICLTYFVRSKYSSQTPTLIKAS
jgi:hypothetical protein